jgi:hypothetical protein
VEIREIETISRLANLELGIPPDWPVWKNFPISACPNIIADSLNAAIRFGG